MRTAWDRVTAARSQDRPTAAYYIEHLFDDFMMLHGDRFYGDDAAVIGGLAMLDGRPLTVIGQEKGHGSQARIQCNFGMPHPEGYRKAARLMQQAEKFHRPVICLVDTSGAYPGIGAEERGQGEAIARNLQLMAGLQVPTLSIFIGEGGSGGALALAVANEVWMQENAVYSVLSPEGFASILWKDGKLAKEAAKVMKMTANDLKKLGVIEKLLPEPEPLTRENAGELIRQMRGSIGEFLGKYDGMTGADIAAERYQRFRSF